MATSLKTFPKTIEVFKKFMLDKNLTDKVSEFNGCFSKQFQISEKQFNWLNDTYIKEGGITQPNGSQSVSDADGQYSFGYGESSFNVPRYIPNRQQYGKNYFITYWPNKK